LPSPPLLGAGIHARRLRYSVGVAIVVGAYVGAAKLGIALSVAHGVITPVWAPTGIALAVLVLFGPRYVVAVALGAFIANATSGASIPEALLISVGNTLEAVVGAVLLRRFGFRPPLDRVRDVLALIVFGAVVSTTIAATNGVTVLWISGDVSDYGSDWLLWWLGDAMGNLIVAPLILVWAQLPFRWFTDSWRRVEAVTLLALLAGVSSIVFLAGYWRYPHLLFPLLVWAALRFRQPGATAASFVVASIAIAGAVDGSTPIGHGTTTEVVQILEALIAGIAVSLLILGAVLEERDDAQYELERAHALLTEAQEVAHIGSWEWDVRSNRVNWSDELYRLFGVDASAGPMTFERYVERLTPEDRKRMQEIVAQSAAEGTPFSFEHQVELPNGDIRWLQGRGRVIRDGSGSPIRMVGTSQDITERKQIDDLRDSILSAVSHELRTPLTSILGFATTLNERGAQLSADAYAATLRHVLEQARRLERLLTDLLDLDRLRHGLLQPNLHPTDVGALVTRVVEDHPVDEHPVELTAEPVTAEIDAAKVERIVENLLVNAVKHTPAGTPIAVRVERQDAAALVAVDDGGPGVTDRERQSIFEIFGRGDAAAGIPGTGVGLALVAQFAKLHGGRAWVEDAPQGGASFRVLLPLAQSTVFDSSSSGTTGEAL
jgi:PAS domain S-box-containing protein